MKTPPETSEPGRFHEDITFVYRGSSMHPTFRDGQLLYIRPDTSNLKPGDVIVFRDDEDELFIVHRTVKYAPQGWITQGDSNPNRDATAVLPNQVIGQVVMKESDGKLHLVSDGPAALKRVMLQRVIVRKLNCLRRYLGWPYRALRSCAPFRRWLHLRFADRLQILNLQTPDGLLVKTLFRGKTVAIWESNRHYFRCRKPFDLFLDPPETKTNKLKMP